MSYLLDITRIEPDKYNLLFERFLSPGRVPDIDQDFSDQEAVFNDLIEKYGEDSVAKIITFGTMKPKAVCRKVFSTFEHPTYVANNISKMIPDLCDKMEDAYKVSPRLLQKKEKYPKEFSVIERLEGMISHEGQHAAGIIIYPEISKYLPIKTLGEDRNKRIVAFDMDMIDEIGFHKFDILGLETISIIRETLNSIKDQLGIDIDLTKLDYDDPEVYKDLCRGEVSGVFQLANQSEKVMEQKPKSFVDLIAINSLIRPGVGDWKEYLDRRDGKEYSIRPEREDYMRETEGIITYQEQFLLDAKTYANWGVAFSDKNIRKNKGIKDDVELKKKFIYDSKSNGYDVEVANKVWDEIVEAAAGGYGFNKAHSASYAMVSFQTAYLKHYYPEHFYAALMSGEGTDGKGQVKISQYVAECKQKGIPITPPHINESTERFEVTKDGIAYRITAISHVGDSAIKHINKLKPFKSFDDFLERTEKRYARVNVVTNLIKAGSFDFDEPNRNKLLEKLKISRMTKKKAEEYTPNYEEIDDATRSKWEKEVLGLYLSTHPMEKFGFKSLSEYDEGQNCIQGGEVVEVSPVVDRNNNEMAFITIDTLFGLVKLVIFSSNWNDENKEVMKDGNLILVRGTRSGNNMLVNSSEVLK